MASDFTVTELTEAESPRAPVYVNLDAAWLVRYSRELEGLDSPSEDTIRLRVIAEHLEHLDEKFRNITAKPSAESAEDILREAIMSAADIQNFEPIINRLKSVLTPEAYSAGIIEGKRRYLARSNLPVQSVELTDELRQAIARTPLKPRRVEPAPKSAKPPKVSALSLNGIKLNLTGLK